MTTTIGPTGDVSMNSLLDGDSGFTKFQHAFGAFLQRKFGDTFQIPTTHPSKMSREMVIDVLEHWVIVETEHEDASGYLMNVGFRAAELLKEQTHKEEN